MSRSRGVGWLYISQSKLPTVASCIGTTISRSVSDLLLHLCQLASDLGELLLNAGLGADLVLEAEL